MLTLGTDFLNARPGIPSFSHQSAYRRAVKMMRSSAAKAFDLDEEPAAVQDAYGRNPFGQGCLLARRLVERGVPFVEVTLSSVDGMNGLGWDTHAQNFDAVEKLCGVLDSGWATLMTDLRCRGLLESTLIVWMGEFGRTPKINESAGRDHFPNAWSTVLAGGGIRGGQAVGNTGADGEEVKDRPVMVPDLLATVVKGLGIEPTKQNTVANGRPIRHRRPQGKPDQGASGMTAASGRLCLRPGRRAARTRSPRPTGSAVAPRNLIFLAENRPVFVRVRAQERRPAL